MTSAEFKNILLSKGENMLINSGNIITEGQLRAIGAMSSADEARESLKEALRAHFSHEMVDIFSIPLESSFEFRNAKRVEIISPEDRPSLRITVKLFVASCDARLVEEAVESCLHELGVASLDAVILKTQGLDTPCKSAPLHISNGDSPRDGIQNHNSGCRLLKCYEVLERFYDAGKIAEIGIADIENLENLQTIISNVRVKPTVNQLHQRACETLGSEVVEFADANQIELLTHNDPEDMMSTVDASSIISSLFWDDSERLKAVSRHNDNLAMSNQDGGFDSGVPTASLQKSGIPLISTPNWHFRWLARYAIVVKCRGIIKGKGYLAQLGRDLRHLSPAVDQTINSNI